MNLLSPGTATWTLTCLKQKKKKQKKHLKAEGIIRLQGPGLNLPTRAILLIFDFKLKACEISYWGGLRERYITALKAYCKPKY